MTYKIITVLLLMFSVVAVHAAEPESPAGYSSLVISKNIPRGGEVHLDKPVGLYCGAGCAKTTHPYPSGVIVKLTAVASPGYAFSGWSGDCSGAGLACALVMDANKNVIANFEPAGSGAAANATSAPSVANKTIKPPNFGASIPSLPADDNKSAAPTASARSGFISPRFLAGSVILLFIMLFFTALLIWKIRRP